MELANNRFLVNASWLVRLRWLAVFGQILTVLAVSAGLGISVPVMELSLVILLTLCSNVAFATWLVSTRGGGWPSPRILTLVLSYDLLSLTALLALTGGLANPFCVFFLVNLTLSGMILDKRHEIAVLVLAIACLICLSFVYRPLEDFERTVFSGAWQAWSVRDLGRLVAMVTCAATVVWFVARLSDGLRTVEAELRVAEQRRAESQRLEALGTLAAGAGHELATPLSTIAVVASELRRACDQSEVPSEFREDVELIRTEVQRCRAILNRMSGTAGQAAAVEMSRIPVEDLVQGALGELKDSPRVVVTMDENVGRRVLKVPVQSVQQAVRAVLQNAFDASPPSSQVALEVQWRDAYLELAVQDQGPGMPTQVLARASDPFFTTKQPGEGMGLGLFLTRSVVERLGGRLEIRSAEREGTRVVIALPNNSS